MLNSLCRYRYVEKNLVGIPGFCKPVNLLVHIKCLLSRAGARAHIYICVYLFIYLFISVDDERFGGVAGV